MNQLLTYLDGVESREGIYVVGASSRPELIDPAILRPGRLDKILLCDFPNKEERFNILKLYYNKAHNNKDIEVDDMIDNTLNEIAENSNTQYYTGADLQSLIYNSFLLAVKRNIEIGLNEAPIILPKDLTQAYKEFKRSLSDKDIQFHNEVKKKFVYRTISTLDDNTKYMNENKLKTTFY